MTEIKLPHSTVIAFIRGLFPELGHDAYIADFYGNVSASVEFKINHTVQARINRDPITLQLEDKDVATSGD